MSQNPAIWTYGVAQRQSRHTARLWMRVLLGPPEGRLSDGLSDRTSDKEVCQVANLDSSAIGSSRDGAPSRLKVSLRSRTPCLGLCCPLQGSCQLMLPASSCSVNTAQHCKYVLVQSCQTLGIMTSCKCSYGSTERCGAKGQRCSSGLAGLPYSASLPHPVKAYCNTWHNIVEGMLCVFLSKHTPVL